MSLTLHRINVVSQDDDFDEHVFVFSLDNAHRLEREIKSVESEEFNFGGTEWSLVCARKEETHLGVFLKWRYSDSGSAMMVSAKTSFGISIIHQHKYNSNVTFSSPSQNFSSSLPLLGKSKLLPIVEFVNPARGFLDSTGRQAMLELKMVGCSMRFETIVDVSPKNRTRKNASGVYFDTNTFVLANRRWFLRFYTKKVNSSGLPAVYLYLHGGSQGISITLQFTLFLGNDSTELLKYDFGEGAKFDGFGKTLADQFSNPDKLSELNVAVDIAHVVIFKLLFLKLPTLQPLTSYNQTQRQLRKSPLFFSKPPSRSASRERLSTPTFNARDLSQQVFQDHQGNPWKVEFPRNSYLEREDSTMIVFEKGVYQYQNNKTKLACIQLYIMSQDLDVAQDVGMSNPPMICYFSNSLDDKGYPINFPVSLQQLATEKFGYCNENNEILIRIDFTSVQTSSFPIRSGPKFDYLIVHQLDRRDGGMDVMNLTLKEMNASRGSLSILDERPPSDSSCSSGLVPLTSKSGSDSLGRIKSVESLLSSEHSDLGGPQFNRKPQTNSFLFELLQCLGGRDHSKDSDSQCLTNRTTRAAESLRDVRRLNSCSFYDETTLVRQARCSAREELRQKEITEILRKFLEQTFPLQVSEVISLGSQGTTTSTPSRCDVDLVIISPDIPRENQNIWAPPLLQTLRKFIEQASVFEASISSLNCTSFATTPFSLQFTCEDFLDVDIWISHDWSNESATSIGVAANDRNYQSDKFNSLFEITQQNSKDLRFFEMSSCRQKAAFFCELTAETKDYIKVVKHWRNSVEWVKFEYRPDSYLISLLVIKAAEEIKENNLEKVLLKVARFIMEPELRISWRRFYDDATARKFIFDPPTPLIQDPTNPAINVASRLKYWGQFKTEYLLWMERLQIKS